MASVFGRTYIFVALERVGGIMVYEVVNPSEPAFVQYINLRNFSNAPNSGDVTDRDLGPEALPVVETPTGPILIVSNEVSGALRTFSIAQTQ